MSKKYMFEYSESNVGVIIVTADSDAEALDLAQCGDGGYMSRSKHLAYMAIPEEYIIVPQDKYVRLMLTSDGNKLVSERLKGVRCGYVDYKYVNMTTVSTEISRIIENIEKLNRDLSVLQSFKSNTK